jgi:predicted DNA-binding transcriptional regulator AlpA
MRPAECTTHNVSASRIRCGISFNIHARSSITFISRKEVERINGMSKSWLYQAMAADRFPKPVVCSGSPTAPLPVRWVLSEVLRCATERNRGRDCTPRD